MDRSRCCMIPAGWLIFEVMRVAEVSMKVKCFKLKCNAPAVPCFVIDDCVILNMGFCSSDYESSIRVLSAVLIGPNRRHKDPRMFIAKIV